MIVEKRYGCPMKEHYAIFTDANTRCPKCGMALVEVDADNGDRDIDHGDMVCDQDKDDGHRFE